MYFTHWLLLLLLDQGHRLVDGWLVWYNLGSRDHQGVFGESEGCVLEQLQPLNIPWSAWLPSLANLFAQEHLSKLAMRESRSSV